MIPDIRIHIVYFLLHEDTLSTSQIRSRLQDAGLGEFTPRGVGMKIKQMASEGYIRKINAISTRRKFVYAISDRPLWGQYDSFRVNSTRYKILVLGSKGLERREIADILAREGIPPRETYESMVKMYTHGWVRIDGVNLDVTQRGRFVLSENRLIAAHNLRGKQREFHSLSLGQNEGISAGGIPS